MMRPNVVVSKCLGFERCRYNGDTIPNDHVDALKKHVNFITVCPEVEIGLGVPRKPIRIVHDEGSRLWQPATRMDHTDKMVEFSRKFLGSLQDIDGFILKYGSPSCGMKNVRIYNEYEPKSSPRKGPGFFGGAVVERFRGLAIEDEGRLSNFTIRENFYIKLFCLARSREISSMKELTEFHAENKYLFMAFDQERMREMGRIAADHDKKGLEAAYEGYRKSLMELLSKTPSFRSYINSLIHMFGGISSQLDSEEKRLFLDTIEEYRDERIPLSVLTRLIESWAMRFKNEYLLKQSILRPFPKDLIDITDSGKGR